MAKKQEKATAPIPEYPFVKGNQYVCSDGQQFSDMYYANRHEQSINNKKIVENGTEQD